MSPNWNLKLLVVICILASVSIAAIGFYPQDDSFITIVGKIGYFKDQYPDLRLKINITEDGKPFQKLEADRKGKFQVKVFLNHTYVFSHSMDFHVTTKVEINTIMPERLINEGVGGVFEYECFVYERYDGVNYNILKRPLLKIKYHEEENKFKYNEEYANDMMYELEGFQNQVRAMKQRKKPTVKDEPEKVLASSTKPKKQAKAIVFESEKEKAQKESKGGHRNIMEGFEEKELVKNEYKEADSILKESEKVELDESIVVETIESEELFLEEEVDISDFITLSVIPKRVEISEEVIEEESVEENQELQYSKMKTQEMLELRRIEEEAKIKEEVKSFNYLSYLQNEQRLHNKQIQIRRLKSLIKTIALAEIYFKKEYYLKNPINHNQMIPVIVQSNSASWWVDKERTMIRYPAQVVQFRKETYLFGITYYYRNDQEIDQDTYCREMNELSKNESICAA